MPTAATRSSAAKSKTASKAKTRAPAKPDAIKLLKEDHREAEALFDSFEKARTAKQKASLAAKICMALTVHTQIEEEIFYPAVRGEIEDDMLDEAWVEHKGAKQLIAEIEQMQPGDQYFDAKVTVLGEYIKHHVKEEEQEMFPETRDTEVDLKALGEQMAARKAELMAEFKNKVQ